MEAIATWGQLPNESEPAWAAFKVYRNSGPTRSLKKAARVVGKVKRLIERWSSRHGWQARVAAWDLEQQDLRRDARVQAISDAEERHGKLARALLGRVAAELGSQVKGRCETCGRSPTKLSAGQVATALKAGVEVERLALGQSTAGASTISQSSTTNVAMSTNTALVLLRDPESQRLASELLGRMKALDPATSLRRVAGAKAAAALQAADANGKKLTGHAAIKAAQAVAIEERREAHLLAADPSGHDRTAAEELGDDERAAVEAQAEADDATRDHLRRQVAGQRAAKAKRQRKAEELDDDDDLFPEVAEDQHAEVDE